MLSHKHFISLYTSLYTNYLEITVPNARRNFVGQTFEEQLQVVILAATGA